MNYDLRRRYCVIRNAWIQSDMQNLIFNQSINYFSNNYLMICSTKLQQKLKKSWSQVAFFQKLRLTVCSVIKKEILTLVMLEPAMFNIF